jgi:hypothetical protein
MSDPIYTDTVGLAIRLTLLSDGEVHDPSGATRREITIQAPDGSKVVRPAEVGTDSSERPCLQYMTVAGDLAKAGRYEATPYIEDAAGKWPGESVSWHVYRSRR